MKINSKKSLASFLVCHWFVNIFSVFVAVYLVTNAISYVQLYIIALVAIMTAMADYLSYFYGRKEYPKKRKGRLP